MLPESQDRLAAVPYESVEGRPVDQFFNETVGATCSGVRRLREEVIADLGDTGVVWWQNHLDARRRMLIAEHLIDCISAIDGNLAEAALHHMEAEGWWRRESERLAEAIAQDPNGNPTVRSPKPRTAADLLPNQAAQLHLAGFFRAIGSALDCLGAALVGVLGLPLDLRKADYGTAERHLGKMSPASAGTPGEHLQHATWQRLVKLEKDAGPQSWRQWACDYRNMLVHRGRRLLMATLTPKEPVLLRPDGIPYAEAYCFLAAEPGKSQLEAFVAYRHRDQSLSERAETTMQGLFDSALNFAAGVGDTLAEVWVQRRESPKLILQPRDQWKRPDLAPNAEPFPGYRPGSKTIHADAFFASEDRVRRFYSAALDDRRRKELWEGEEV